MPLAPFIRPRFLRRRRGVALGRDLPALPSPLLRLLYVRLTTNLFVHSDPDQGSADIRDSRRRVKSGSA